MNRAEFSGARDWVGQGEELRVLDPKECRRLGFDPVSSGLPLTIQSQCLECKNLLDATMIDREGKVVIEKTCPDHGTMAEELHDALFSEMPPDRRRSPEYTYTGHRIRPVVRGLPKTVETLCPECRRNIIGRVFDWRGDVYMEKTCPDHGYVKDKVTTNTKLYLKMQQWSFEDHPGLSNPQVRGAFRCPSECGICNMHQSVTLLGQIDLTNRCDLACPICFANANVKGYVFEPEFDEIVEMMQALRDYRPIPTTAIQFTGGEPTIRADFLDLVRKAKELGFSHIQIASNGLTLADPDFTMACAEAGLHSVYLQFDGVDDRVYEETRGRKLFDIKCKALENIHRAGMKAVLVPTIVDGINNDQVVKILEFAIDNIHAISGIAYQPVAFTGRISTEEREAQRYTLGDLGNDLATTGFVDVDRDFYPLSLVAPLSRLLAALAGKPKPATTSHPNCAAGTYFVVDQDKKATPISKFFDSEKLFAGMNDLAAAIEGSRFKWFHKLRVYNLFRKTFIKKHAPEGMSPMVFMRTIQGMTDHNVGRGKNEKKMYRTLMAAGMHFQDAFNFDVVRVKRCLIHYSTPDGIFPFCTYNSGPVHRERVEKRHSMTMKQWKAREKGRARK
ncbi:MAG: radical SAM protein [Candidatus Latescibacterota bacterium]|nr:MAG: radical SAM protein [Candidatus Latescibacterota bacterium]